MDFYLKAARFLTDLSVNAKSCKKLEEILSTEQRFKNVERSAVEIINAVTKSNMKIEEVLLFPVRFFDI